jgi:hypothetical protein
MAPALLSGYRVKTFLYLIAILIITGPAKTYADMAAFEKLNNSDLSIQHTKAILRILAVDQYHVSQFGAAPNPSFKSRGLDLQDFENISQEWLSNLPAGHSSDPDCNQYIDNFKNLLADIIRSYNEMRKEWYTSERGLILRTRIEAQELLLKSEVALADQGAEGGMSPVTNAGRLCPSINHNNLVVANHRLETSMELLNDSWWGKRGLSNAHVVTTPLMKVMIHDENTRNRWAVPKFLLGAVGPIVAVEFLTGGAATGFQIASFATRGLLRLTTILGSAAFGAYQGFKMGDSSSHATPYIGDPWSETQYSAEQLLKLPRNDTKPYYEIATQIENSTLNINEQLLEELNPQMEKARNRFGSLENARSLAVKKVDEIETVMKERSLPISKVSF